MGRDVERNGRVKAGDTIRVGVYVVRERASHAVRRATEKKELKDDRTRLTYTSCLTYSLLYRFDLSRLTFHI